MRTMRYIFLFGPCFVLATGPGRLILIDVVEAWIGFGHSRYGLALFTSPLSWVNRNLGRPSRNLAAFCFV
jgi:hypothetical protein